MAEIIDCSIEFKIRQDLNRVRRVVDKLGYTQRVFLTIEPNEKSHTGYGIVVVDKDTNEQLAIDMDLLAAR
jgi:hypothetical protein